MLITSWYYDERSQEFKKTSLKELIKVFVEKGIVQVIILVSLEVSVKA